MGRPARGGLAAAGLLHRPQVAERGPARPGDHPRPGLGASRSPRTPGRSWRPRARSSTSGSTPRSSTSARRRSGPTRTRRTGTGRRGGTTPTRPSATPSSWPRTTSPSTPSCSRPPSLGVREPWKKVDYVKAFNWLTYYGGKFSTSQKRGVFTDQALDILPADYWRYFLIANAPESGRLVLHLGALHRHGEQGPGRHPRQLRQPRAVLQQEAVRRGGPGRRRARRGGGTARRGDRPPARRVRGADGGAPVPQGRRSPAGLWSAGNSYLEEKAPGWRSRRTRRARPSPCVRR